MTTDDDGGFIHPFFVKIIYSNCNLQLNYCNTKSRFRCQITREKLFLAFTILLHYTLTVLINKSCEYLIIVMKPQEKHLLFSSLNGWFVHRRWSIMETDIRLNFEFISAEAFIGSNSTYNTDILSGWYE